MKLTRRGEIVFAITSLTTSLLIIGAVLLGAYFLLTHHQETDQSTCHRVDVGVMCNWHWERN